MSNYLTGKPTTTDQPTNFFVNVAGAIKQLSWAGFVALLNALYVPLARTINGHALNADVTLTKTDVGLGNVSNLAPADLPISTATQSALDLKANLADLVGLLDLKASVDASTNPNYPAALKGDARFISAAGKVGGAAGKVVEVGDVMIATADNAGGTEASVGASWTVIQSNIMGITAYGMALIQAADYAAMRTLLSLVAGTNFNAYRAEVDKLGVGGSAIASAGTIDLGAATGDYCNITGTTTITTLGTVASGTRRKVRFTGALTIMNNATSLILPTGTNITTAANDVAEFTSLGSGNWICTGYMRASGAPLAGVPVSGTDFNAYRSELDKMSAARTSVVSASTVNIGGASSDYIQVSGSTAITAFSGGASGMQRVLQFTSVMTLTHNSTSLILPTAANITTASGDVAIFRADSSSNWRCIAYMRASGVPLAGIPVAGTNFNAYRPEVDLLGVKGSSLASAASLNIESTTGDFIDITGTNSISTFYTVGSTGKQRVLRFTGVLTLAHSSTLILPTASDITTAAGDVAIFRSIGANAWQCISYMRADGNPVASHRHDLSDINQSGATSGQVPQWNGSAWVPVTPSAGSDSKVVCVQASLSGHTSADIPATAPAPLYVYITSAGAGTGNLYTEGGTWGISFDYTDPGGGRLFVDISSGSAATIAANLCAAVMTASVNISAYVSGTTAIISNIATGAAALLNYDDTIGSSLSGGGNGTDDVPAGAEISQVKILGSISGKIIRPIRLMVINNLSGLAVDLVDDYDSASFTAGISNTSGLTVDYLPDISRMPKWVSGAKGNLWFYFTGPTVGGDATALLFAEIISVDDYGTFLYYTCSGTDYVAVYADGSGGTYTVTVESSSSSCGFGT